jgi:PAS domain S-box-containing protein
MDPARQVLDSIPDAVVVASGEGLVMGWQGGAQRLFGYSEAEVLGRPVTFLFPEAPDRDLDELATLGGGPGIETVVPVRRRSGRGFLAAVTVRPLPEEAGTVALIKAMGPWLDPRHSRGRTNPEWDRVLGRVLRELIELAGVDLAGIDRTDTLARVLVEQGRRMVPGTECLMSLVPHDRQDNFRIVAGAGPWASTLVGGEWPWAGTVAGLAMSRRRPIETVRLMERSLLRPRLASGGIHTGRLIPLMSRDALPDGRAALGVFGFYRRDRAYFTPYQRRLMKEFAGLASLTLQRTELSAATARAAGRLQVGVDAAHDLAGTLAPVAVVRALIDRALAATGADRVTVVRVEGDEYEIVEAVDLGGERDPVGRRFAVGAFRDRSPARRPLIRLALETGEIMRGPGHTVEGMGEAHARALIDLQHTLVMPLRAGGPPVALIFARRRAEDFSAGDLATLQTLGNMAVLALRNAWLYAQVEDAARVKSDFLNMAAHELRTPLTVVRGYLSMLGEGSFGPVPETWEPPLKILDAKTEELGRLVDDLLLAARLETGRVTISREPVDLNRLASAAVDRARLRARSLHADLRFEGARRPLVVEADPEQLGRVLDALLANALAYSAGRSWVRVRVRPGPRGLARVEVEDRGRGIASEHAGHVFDRFYRVDDERWPAQPGTGLGLYIGRELALRQGALLALERSAPDHGSLFVLSIPEVGPGPDD